MKWMECYEMEWFIENDAALFKYKYKHNSFLNWKVPVNQSIHEER